MHRKVYTSDVTYVSYMFRHAPGAIVRESSQQLTQRPQNGPLSRKWVKDIATAPIRCRNM